MATDYEITRPNVDAPPADVGKPDVQPAENDPYAGVGDVDKQYWISCLDDSERTEQLWRQRGREIIQIYRNESSAGKGKKQSDTTFNILYSNTEVMAPAVYQKPPKPMVRSRFTSVEKPPMPPPMMPGLMGPPGPPGMAPGGMPGLGGMLPGGMPGGPPAPPEMPPIGGPPAMPAPPMPPNGASAVPPTPPPPLGAQPPPMPPASPMPPIPGPPPGMPLGAAPPPSFAPLAPPPPNVPSMPPMGQLPAGPSKPLQSDIETAASVMQKTLEIVVDDENSSEAVKMAIKDVLLPGRGVARVRWKPQMEKQPAPSQPGDDPAAEPVMQDVKVWEEVCDEYVYWEDFLCDPTRSAADQDWMAFRHLFTQKQLDEEFADSPQYKVLKTANRMADILRWTDESAAKSPVGGGAALKSARNLGDHVKKCMIWEIWSRNTREVIWFCRDAGGIVFRVDPDTYQLKGFYPCPMALLAVTTTDSRIPRPYYDLYAKLAGDLDETSARISQLTKKIKARGAYNSASTDIADILKADDGKMLPVDGVDMLNGGLQNHIWMLPIEIYMQCLQQLYMARDQIKQAIYEIMGISDIMRGATRATETATAQRIKGSMGMSRLEDQKQAAANFVRDLLRLKAELICQNFDAETLAQMTGEDVTPSVMAILRSDFSRTCLIDIESDSTVVPDLQAEQQGIAMVMQAVQMVMQGVQGMLMTQMMPPDKVIAIGLELLKMALHPVPYSRGVVELINDFQKQIAAMPPMPFPPPAPPPMMGHNGGPPMDKPGVPGVGPPPGRPNIPPTGVSHPNGGPPPAPQMHI
jgi:hypothetical protein